MQTEQRISKEQRIYW